MADMNFDQVGGGFGATGQGHSGSFLLNLAGAATSVALVFGLGYWGYKLAVRDMAGIPVVRALEGPMRIAPQDPGGEIAVHQGLSVNSVAAEGAASRPSDSVILAPLPVDLVAEDLAGTSVAVPAPVSGRDMGSPGIAMLPPLTEENMLNPSESEGEDPALMAALAEALSDGVTPLSGDTGLISGADPSFDLPAGNLANSPRPMPRPGTFSVASAAGDVASVPEIDGTSLPAGTRLVQLGAFDSAETARTEWDRLSGKFSDLLVGKTRIVQAAQSSGRTFYRLRADGFENEADSRRFCSALVAEKAACIPVTVR